MLKVIDLFSGVGGLSIGFQMAGYEILYANEINKQIANSYQENHQNVIVDNRDINTINIRDCFFDYKNKVDLIIGGPPCQGFSQKGKRLGINDDRNFLFKKFIEVVDYINPFFFLMENVPNILTSQNSHFLNQIKLLFSQIGYNINYKIVNSYDYGVPQKRKRAVIIGNKINKEFEFPEKFLKFVNVYDAISDLPVLNSGEGKMFINYPSIHKTKYQEFLRKKSDGIWNHVATNHSLDALERLKFIPPFGGKKDLPEDMLTKSIYSGTWCRIDPNGPARTITTRFDTPSSGEFTLNDQDRCLTVREAARLQSFPDSIKFTGTKSSQMIQVGNAVPPLLAKNIAQRIMSYL